MNSTSSARQVENDFRLAAQSEIVRPFFPKANTSSENARAFVGAVVATAVMATILAIGGVRPSDYQITRVSHGDAHAAKHTNG